MATFFDKQSGKAELTSEEIEQLQKQLKEKTEEIRVIYNKLSEAGVVPLPDDFLDSVAGGKTTTERPSFWLPSADPKYENAREI